MSTTGSLFTCYGTPGRRSVLPTPRARVHSCLLAALVDVDAVELRIAVLPKSTQARPTTYITRVSLPNHDAVPRLEATP